jgi:signal transduction histidine kinase
LHFSWQTLAGLALAAFTVTARPFPVISALCAYLTCAASLATGLTIQMPLYLLVCVPLWAVTRWASLTAVAWGGAGVAVGGLAATAASVGAGMRIAVVLPGVGERVSWVPDTPEEAFVIAISVWLTGLGAMALGVLGRWGEAARQAGRREQANLMRTELLAAQQALTQERTQISREMHDIVAHSLSVIIAQADGGRYAAAANPQAAVGALEAIAETGRAALADMRGIVRILRDGPPDESLRLAPAPHVRDLDSLVNDMRSAGLAATLVRVGQPHYLPPGLGATLQRIAQEALTNALKHAGPGTQVTITERWLPGRIELVVADDGRGAAAPNDGEGHGLIGMRERAEAMGGEFSAGPGPTGGFVVSTALPLPASARAGGNRTPVTYSTDNDGGKLDGTNPSASSR